jgi:hypothetical protein
MPALRAKLTGAENVIIESNSVLKFVRPQLYLPVLNPSNEDFKDSARQFLDLADAMILHQMQSAPAWQGISFKPIADKPIFRIHPPPYVTPEIVDFVRQHIR